MKLILASASPRRAELLHEAGYELEVRPATIDEAQFGGVSPGEIAQRLAQAKAEVIATQCPEDVVLAADTIVCLGERILGKPNDEKHAREMLELLSGTTQIVITGVCVMHKAAEFQQSTRVMTAVRMDNLTVAQLNQYIASGDWRDKEGGYGIQDNDPLVKRIAGSHSNVVGLPMEVTTRILAKAGIMPKGK